MRTTNADLLTVFKAADRSGDLPAAWAKHGKPTTLKNTRRALKTYFKGKAAAVLTAAAVLAAAEGPSMAWASLKGWPAIGGPGGVRDIAMRVHVHCCVCRRCRVCFQAAGIHVVTLWSATWCSCYVQ